MTGTNPARIEADYLLETAYPLEAAAEAIAGEAVERYLSSRFPARLPN